jgi:hypothetical protein
MPLLSHFVPLTRSKTYAAQELCPALALAEPSCCPEKTGTVCDFCPGGVTNPDFVNDFGDGDTPTCAEIDLFVSGLSSDLDTCREVKFARVACCPDDVVASDPTDAPVVAPTGCDFCATGVENEDLEVDEDGTTCGDVGAM